MKYIWLGLMLVGIGGIFLSVIKMAIHCEKKFWSRQEIRWIIVAAFFLGFIILMYEFLR